MKDLIQKMVSLDKKIAAKEVILQDRKTSLSLLEKEWSDLVDEAALLEKVDQVLLAVSTKVLGQSTKTIDKLVTTGLKLTFDDQNLEFRTTTDKSRGKTSVKFELYHNGIQAPLMDAYGGGVLVMVGVLLRVTTIIVLGLKRMLLLDESLSHLSIQYVANASKLMKKLCQELDFTILMVTHEEEFTAHADKHYQASQKGGRVVFTEKRIGGAQKHSAAGS